MTTEERFEKIEAGIRDLIVVSRTVLNSIEQLSSSVAITRDAIEELRGATEELRGAQQHTDEKLNALIQAQTESEEKISRLADTVDKLIRYRGPNGQERK